MQVKPSPENGIIFKILAILPRGIACALEDELSSLGRRAEEFYEIRLRLGGPCSVLLPEGTRPIGVKPSRRDMDEILTALTGGALYAHRDTLAEGYITPASGVRVGVCGDVRYDGGAFVGVSNIRSFVFRIPHGKCDFEDELYGIWKSRCRSGLLIYSPPLCGKTTAVRRLADRIGKSGVHVCVVDERCEFMPDEYSRSEVDILRGYKKSKGIEIAVRTLGAELVVVDEIGASEAVAVLSSLTLGVPFVATAHARDAEELVRKVAFLPFFEAGAFETLVGIKKSAGVRRLEVSYICDTEGRVKLTKGKTLL